MRLIAANDKKGLKVYVLLLFVLLIACIPKKKNDAPEEIKSPLKSYKLPPKLDEISGLDRYSNEELVMINDEEGILYFFNLKNEFISRTIKFKKKGDFEGLAVVGSIVYALESSGKIYRVEPSGEKSSFEISDGEFDLEGLCYHHERNSLLIACKEQFKKGKDDKIWVLEYNLSQQKLEEEPFLKIDRSKVSKNFRPSGIAFDHKENLVITSAVNESIVQFNKSNEVVKEIKLPKKKYPQVEGITFDETGAFFLASEKAGMKNAMLYKIKHL